LVAPDEEADLFPFDKKSCEARLRAQIYDFMGANEVELCFEIIDSKLKSIIDDEIKHRHHEKFSKDTKLLSGGYTGSDFLPDKVNHGKEASLSSNKRLKEAMERVMGVRKGTFGAFVKNYVSAIQNESDRPAAIEQMKKLLYPDIIKLGYFKYLKCKHAWAQQCVEEAYNISK